MYEDMKVFMGSSNGKNTKQTKLKMGMRSVHILPCAFMSYRCAVLEDIKVPRNLPAALAISHPPPGRACLFTSAFLQAFSSPLFCMYIWPCMAELKHQS